MEQALFQNFETSSDIANSSVVISYLRDKLLTHNIDGYLIPHNDEYHNEYLPDDAQHLSYATAFTGSWGLCLVTKTHIILYCDGRYKLQALTQVSPNIKVICTSDITIKDDFQNNLTDYLPKNAIIGFDDNLFSKTQIDRFSTYIQNSNGVFKAGFNIREMLGYYPPKQEYSQIIIHDHSIAGKTVSEKISLIQNKIIEFGGDYLLCQLPEMVCWLLNLRANDTPHTPLMLSRLILSKNGDVFLFIDKSRITQDIQVHLPNNIIIYDELKDFFHNNNFGSIICDDDINLSIYNLLLSHNFTVITPNIHPVILEKSRKNHSEISATKKSHFLDGKAMIYFMHYLDTNKHNNLSEIQMVSKLEEFRRQMGIVDISFDTISGTGANGAIIHYRVTKNTNRIWRDGELFLCDSGGQYYDGTTDITRVFVRGVPTEEMSRRYTQVLKGHLALSNAKFPKGTTGSSLDILARQFLWNDGVDYAHGTGHGVGLYLSVHEGPQSISSRSNTPLEAGMLLSNEPGYYKDGEFGIRIENIELVVEIAPNILGFETLTLVPYELDLIDKNLLSNFEINQINAYHQGIYNIYANDTTFDKDILEYLRTKTIGF